MGSSAPILMTLSSARAPAATATRRLAAITSVARRRKRNRGVMIQLLAGLDRGPGGAGKSHAKLSRASASALHAAERLRTRPSLPGVHNLVGNSQGPPCNPLGVGDPFRWASPHCRIDGHLPSSSLDGVDA